MTIDQLTTFFGWCAALNIAVLFIALIGVTGLRNFATGLQSRMFGLEVADVNRAYFSFLSTYKLLTLIFSVVPYLVLRLFM
jgi:Family of unknown function (DUF6868)